MASIQWGRVFRLCRPPIACCVGFDSRLHNLLVEAIQSELPRPSHRSETRPSADKTLLLEPTFCRLGCSDRDPEKDHQNKQSAAFVRSRTKPIIANVNWTEQVFRLGNWHYQMSTLPGSQPEGLSGTDSNGRRRMGRSSREMVA